MCQLHWSYSTCTRYYRISLVGEESSSPWPVPFFVSHFLFDLFHIPDVCKFLKTTAYCFGLFMKSILDLLSKRIFFPHHANDFHVTALLIFTAFLNYRLYINMQCSPTPLHWPNWPVSLGMLAHDTVLWVWNHSLCNSVQEWSHVELPYQWLTYTSARLTHIFTYLHHWLRHVRLYTVLIYLCIHLFPTLMVLIVVGMAAIQSG